MEKKRNLSCVQLVDNGERRKECVSRAAAAVWGVRAAASVDMKGTNPITQGHRWHKRVKKRLKKEQKEEGQWEVLEEKKWAKWREEQEAAAAAQEEGRGGEEDESPSGELKETGGGEEREAAEISYWGSKGTTLRDEEGLDEEEAAAVRAVKAAAEAAGARLRRVASEDGAALPTEEKTSSSSAKKKRKKAHTGLASANPFAGLVAHRPAKAGTHHSHSEGAPGPSPEKRKERERERAPSPPAPSFVVDRAHRAALGLQAAKAKSQLLGIQGRAGGSAKKLKKLLKKQKLAGL